MIHLLVLSFGDSQFIGHVIGEILSGYLHQVPHPLGWLPRDGVELLHCELSQCNLEGQGWGREREREGESRCV